MKSRIKVGDVIAFRLDGSRFALGQVVGDWTVPGHHFVALFGPFEGQAPDADRALEKPRLLGLTTDAKVRSGDWKVLTNRNPNPSIDLPAYQVTEGTIHQVMAEDFSGTRKRPATPEERQTLPRRVVSSANVLERAMRSLAGLEPWIPAFDTLRPLEGATTRRVFGG